MNVSFIILLCLGKFSILKLFEYLSYLEEHEHFIQYPFVSTNTASALILFEHILYFEDN